MDSIISTRGGAPQGLSVTAACEFQHMTGSVDTENPTPEPARMLLAERRSWLLEVLQRQDARAPGGEYSTLLEDLTSYGTDPGSSADADSATGQTVRTKPWLSKGRPRQQTRPLVPTDRPSGSNGPRLARDWWSRSGIDYLIIQTSLIQGKHELTDFTTHKNRLEVIGNSRKLSKMTRSLMKKHGNFFSAMEGLRTPQARDLWRSLILRLLQETGEHLGIGRPRVKAGQLGQAGVVPVEEVASAV